MNGKNLVFHRSLGLFGNNFFHKPIAFAVAVLFVLSIGSAIGITFQYTESSSRDIEWDVTLNFTESGGKNDYIIFGEDPDASDDVDIYDAPNPPGGVSPFLDAYFTTDFPWPHDTLLQEIKEYPDTEKEWNFTVWWTGSDTIVTLSWDTGEVDDSEYYAVTLSDDTGSPLADMLNEGSYVFFCPDNGFLHFQILCGSNQPPIANDDLYDTYEDTKLLVTAPGTLGNDVDTDGPDPLTAFLDDDVAYGTLTFNDDGSFDYMPDPDWSGVDSFTYHAFDGEDDSNIATVTITVDPINDDPLANDDSAIVEEHSSDNQIDVLDNDDDVDGDDLEIIGVTTPSHGTATYDEEYVYYTPEDEYSGSDSFTYTVTDNNGSAGVFATVSIMITPNEPPEKPDKPSGETRGKVGVEYPYTTSTTDINDDQVYYYFSWGDGAASGWLGPFESGDPGEASHTWNRRGNYEIKVKSKDEHGLESEWSDPLPISMPKDKAFFNSVLLDLLQRLMERFPLLEQILTSRPILGLLF